MSENPEDGAREDLTVEEAEELEMELELASFEQSLPDDVEMHDSHRIAFRAGFTQARRAAAPGAEPSWEAVQVAAYCQIQGFTNWADEIRQRLHAAFAVDFPARPGQEAAPPTGLSEEATTELGMADALLPPRATIAQLRAAFVGDRAGPEQVAEACALVCESRAASHGMIYAKNEAEKCAMAIRSGWRQELPSVLASPRAGDDDE